MKSLTQFVISESADQEEKLKHLEHAEDHVINAGHEGFKHAFNTLHGVHQSLAGKKSGVTVSHKFDGSPSIVFGTNPHNGKFFVASKSAFNKDPKLNYTAKDVETNHGHAPGLVEKLKAALVHLKKVTPPEGVYQGDVMHTPEDVKHARGRVHFTPNTISYSVPEDSEEAQKIKQSKLGVAVHTAYHGNSFEELKAEYNPDLSHFVDHKDVHVLHSRFEHGKTTYSPEQQKEYQSHMKAAVDANNDITHYGHLENHVQPLKTYINKTVRSKSAPSTEGYIKHLREVGKKDAEKVKTPAAKERKMAQAEQMVKHVDKNRAEFDNTLLSHHHLQAAKNVLVHALNSHESDYEHHIQGVKSKPEGFVAVSNNRPTKLVHRHVFSQANFAKNA